MQRICVFGLGYVGSVTAACLASAGHRVIGVDVSTDKVKKISRGLSPIFEPGLESMIQRVVNEGRLSATTSCSEAVSHSDVALVCVGTPGDEAGQLDTSALMRVAEQIGEALRLRHTPFTVVIRSTVLPGTIEKELRPLILEKSGVGEDKIRFAANPEFIREGTALSDFFNPPFTLVGSDDADTANLLRLVYACVNARTITTGIEVAELVKYTSNAYHALKVCFANEVANACEAFGADAREVMRIFAMDRNLNISEAYLKPGFAFGGSCLPKDLKALLYAARHADVPVPLLESILGSNQLQVSRAIASVLATGKRRIGVVGLSFKPDTDDLRESPMVSLVESLIGKGCDVRILDSNVRVSRLIGANRRFVEQEIPHIAMLMCDSVSTLMAHAEVVVLGNAGSEAQEVMQALDGGKTVIDLTRGDVAVKVAASSQAA